jgi:hypothetical protein
MIRDLLELGAALAFALGLIVCLILPGRSPEPATRQAPADHPYHCVQSMYGVNCH